MTDGSEIGVHLRFKNGSAAEQEKQNSKKAPTPSLHTFSLSFSPFLFSTVGDWGKFPGRTKLASGPVADLPTIAHPCFPIPKRNEAAKAMQRARGRGELASFRNGLGSRLWLMKMTHSGARTRWPGWIAAREQIGRLV
jgi:hypothetical protein